MWDLNSGKRKLTFKGESYQLIALPGGRKLLSARQFTNREGTGTRLELFDLAASDPQIVERLMQHPLPEGVRIERHGDVLSCFTPAGSNFPLSFLDEVRSAGLPFSVRRASLEDVFLNLTGRELRE